MTVLFNHTMPEERRRVVEALLSAKEFHEPHVWIATSGSFAKEGVSKWAALSHNAIEASAMAVNAHLEASANDIWLNPLPLFHVGGLGITWRARLSGSQEFPFAMRWCPDAFFKALVETEASLTALVPTQLFDLIMRGYQSPASLRSVVIGGGALDEALYQKAKNLGWNGLPSYGMTEAASQIATSTGGRSLKLLNHVEVSTKEGLIQVKGPSLLTAYGIIEGETVEFHDPKVNGVFTTSDRGEVVGNELIIHGRADDVVKILGENVDLGKLQKLMDSLKTELQLQGDFYLKAVPDLRTGNALCLVHTASIDKLVEHFNARVFPFERIMRFEMRDVISKTPLGKPERRKL